MARSRLVLSLLLALGCADAVRCADAVDSRVSKLARSACVEIVVEDRHSGSGWIASADGLILTAAHVVDQGENLQVLLPETYERAPARLIATDRGHDLALLRLTEPAQPRPWLRLASRAPRVGREVWLFGAPVFRHGVLLQGRLARGQSTFEYYPDQGHYIECLHVSGMSPLGVSGGPWLNSSGEVVGLQSGSMTVGNALYGVAFMIPLSAIQQLLQHQTNMTVSTAGVAIEETWQQDRSFLQQFPPQMDGLVVRKTTPDGPAARAGIQPWDIIVTVDDRPARLPDLFLRHVRSRRPGTELRLEVVTKTNPAPRAVTIQLAPL